MKLTIHCCCAILFSIVITTTIYAQSAYSVHTLEQGETLSSLAKNYHTTVGDIMRMNGMNAQSKLQPGEQIKIPAGGVVVAQKPAAQPVTTTAATSKPVPAASAPKTHVVAAGETLFHISQVSGVPVEQLKLLNNLSDGGVKVGQTLVLTASGAATQPAKPKTETTASPKETTIAAEPKETSQAAPMKPAVSTATTEQKTKPTNAPEETKPQPSATTQVANLTKPADAPANNKNEAFSNNYPSSADTPKEGFFTNQYGKDGQRGQEQEKDGSAMTFKSASGWADKKYYILMNDAPTGSIVKIKNGRNELYAKVLWNLSEMKENDGLAFRISTAAAAALGVTDQKFDLRVSYYE